MKKISIIDPGMINKLGHHREINCEIAKQLIKIGYSVDIFTHKKYEIDIKDNISGNLKILPTFSLSPYSIGNKNSTESDIFIANKMLEKVFTEELLKLRLAGPVHFSNLFSHQLKGASFIGEKSKVTACVHVHPNRYFNNGEFLWSNSAIELNNRLKNIEIQVVEEMLVNEIDRLTPFSNGTKILPFPLNYQPAKKTKLMTNRIGILGGLRKEQGALNLHETINTIKSAGFDVLLQDTKKMVENTNAVGVRVIGFLDSFANAFEECDAILLNYNPEAYRFMGSGILWEALGNDIPFFYSRGTALSSLARKYSAGIPFSYHDKNSLKAALISFRDNSDEVILNSKKIGLQVRDENSSRKYIMNII